MTENHSRTLLASKYYPTRGILHYAFFFFYPVADQQPLDGAALPNWSGRRPFIVVLLCSTVERFTIQQHHATQQAGKPSAVVLLPSSEDRCHQLAPLHLGGQEDEL